MEGIIITNLLAGLVGGTVRSMVGISKDYNAKGKRYRFNLVRVLISLMVSAAVGITSGLLVEDDWRVAILAGYAGTDFIEGLVMARFSKSR